jgi:hypothetical protein
MNVRFKDLGQPLEAEGYLYAIRLTANGMGVYCSWVVRGGRGHRADWEISV